MGRRRMSDYDVAAANSGGAGYDPAPFPGTSLRDLFNFPSSVQTVSSQVKAADEGEMQAGNRFS
jgi:hypothetical protein